MENLISSKIVVIETGFVNHTILLAPIYPQENQPFPVNGAHWIIHKSQCFNIQDSKRNIKKHQEFEKLTHRERNQLREFLAISQKALITCIPTIISVQLNQIKVEKQLYSQNIKKISGEKSEQF